MKKMNKHWKHKKGKIQNWTQSSPDDQFAWEKQFSCPKPHPLSFMCTVFILTFWKFPPISAKLGLLFVWGQLRDHSNAQVFTPSRIFYFRAPCSTNFGSKLSFIPSFLFPERLHCRYIYFHCFYLYNLVL